MEMTTTPVICLKCGGGLAIRINRNGFWQQKVMSLFGYYPWKCGACGRVFMVRRRSDRARSRKKSQTSAASPTHSESPQNQSPQT